MSDIVTPAVTVPRIDRPISYQGDIWMTVLNDGTFGTESGTYAARQVDMDALKITYAPSFEFPGGSGNDYLFRGGLWIGGIVGADTLVSGGLKATSAGSNEWNAYFPTQSGPPSRFYPSFDDTIPRHLLMAYTTTFSDTFISAQSGDAFRGTHEPLGLEVRQVTHQSPDQFTRRFIIYDYAVKNISDHTIDKMWFGVFLDCDVFYTNAVGCGEALTSDDIGGVLNTWPNPVNPLYNDTLMVAWSADNDGDACGSGSFPRVSTRGAMGVRVIRKPTPDAVVSFNWFTTNFGNIDWGPRLATDLRDFGTGGTGLPEGDANEYHVMSNGEVDYDQPYSAIDYRPEWQRPAQGNAALDIATGLDSRILLSTGPVSRLAAGQTVEFTIAFVAGENVHRDPSSSINPTDPQPYVDKLNFNDLAVNSWWSGYVWDNYGYDSRPDDGNDYRGESYFPVLGGGDPVYYTGDGIPDLSGPAAPPAIDSANADLAVISRPFEFKVRWTGRTSETSLDPLLRTRDLEGYRVYIAERNSALQVPGTADYSLIAQWDRIDYRRYTYRPSLNLWEVDSHPYSKEEWRQIFADSNFNPTDYQMPSLGSCYTYSDTLNNGQVVPRCAYFAPQDANHENKYFAVGDSVLNRIQQVGWRDTVIGGDTVQYGVYEAIFTNMLPSKVYFVSVTAFDYGDPFNNLESLETQIGGVGAYVSAIPIFSADVVEEYDSLGGAYKDSVRVSVYPNPYKIQFPDGQGNPTSYYAEGFEGDPGTGTDRSPLQERDRRIHFINVPSDATISIYTLDGDLVRVLNHPDPNLSGYSSKISWDLVSRNTQSVTSGIYLYRVDSKLGSQVGKLVIIK